MIMEKLKMHTPDLVDANIVRIAELFRNCVTESRDEHGELKRAIDFDLLRQELSGGIVDGPQERYHLDWPGKREALLTANAPIAKTLRPARDESVDFDTTKNLYIEGDNLDALKLLQETYLGKVKMIYIDPPYNTGNDFIYEDDFAEDKDTYFERSMQVDEEGNHLVANTDSNGRFHSDWLSMLYPRLKLARNLLREDGLIFISMGDPEIGNLRKLCEELFGEKNFEGHIHWRRRHNQPNDPTKMIGLVAEHILCYARDSAYFKQKGVGKIELTGSFSNPDSDPRGAWATKPWKVGSDQSGSFYEITTPTGVRYNEEWMGEESTFNDYLKDNRIVFPDGGNGSPRKKYFKFEREEEGQSATNWWSHERFGHNQEGNSILTELMDSIKNTFSNPKPPRLIKSLMSIANCKDGDVVLDYFLGSGSTFHASLEYRSELKIIGMQIPELLSDSIKEHQPAIEFCVKNRLVQNLAEISKERIRRAGKKIKEEAGLLGENLDIGFRVLKVDSSNMKDVYYSPDSTDQLNLLDQVTNIKEDRSAEDLLFQVLLDWGVDLTLPISRETIADKTVFFVDENALAACFDDGINADLVRAIASRKPLRAVFKDNGYDRDDTKINVAEIFKLISPETELKAI